MRPPLEKSGVLDRGGKPTVRELLSSLVFNPVDGTIRLNGERVVMQRAAVGFELRRDLINLLGPQEARIFLMRLGFASGRADARFVRTNWPNLDVGDGFTAGTRLHTFSGVVRVETIYNDFDIRKKRLTAEFVWHDSVEAEEFRRERRHSTEPVCWTQLGYASGYSSEFFDTLVVYKETQCRAEGHDHCRVVGKIAEMWGPNDPDVALFRERIAVALDERHLKPRRTPITRATDASMTELDHLMIAPVLDQLIRYSRMALPVLIEGASGTGRSRAARYIHRAGGAADGRLRQVSGADVDANFCAELSRPARGKANGAPESVLIDGIDLVPQVMQERLVRAIEEGLAAGGPRVIVLANSPSATPAGQPHNNGRAQLEASGLWYAVSSLRVRMPTFAERRGDMLAIGRALLAELSARMGQPLPQLDERAATRIEKASWHGNLRQMRAVLGAAVAGHDGNGPISAAEIDVPLQHLRSAEGHAADETGAALRPWIDSTLRTGRLSLPEIETEAYRAAVAQSSGNLSAAARLLGITRAQLAYRLKTRTG